MIEPVKLADGRFVCQSCLKKFTAYKKSKEHPGGYINEPKFCKTLCRVQFHSNGGLSFKKFAGRVQKMIDERIELKHREYDRLVAKFVAEEMRRIRAELRPGVWRRKK